MLFPCATEYVWHVAIVYGCRVLPSSVAGAPDAAAASALNAISEYFIILFLVPRCPLSWKPLTK